MNEKLLEEVLYAGRQPDIYAGLLARQRDLSPRVSANVNGL
jgi:hypothetical protein